jgi:hypothetical protein
VTHREVLSVHLSVTAGSTNTSSHTAVATTAVAGPGAGSVVVVVEGGGVRDVGGGVREVGGGVREVGGVDPGGDPVVGGVVPDDVGDGALTWPDPAELCPFVPPAREVVRTGAPVCWLGLPFRAGELRLEVDLGSGCPETSCVSLMECPEMPGAVDEPLTAGAPCVVDPVPAEAPPRAFEPAWDDDEAQAAIPNTEPSTNSAAPARQTTLASNPSNLSGSISSHVPTDIVVRRRAGIARKARTTVGSNCVSPRRAISARAASWEIGPL